ncbi:hypothetical protein H6P81_007803 [Aristolochia fimbriata]|uniref:Pentatricopeptide repeat-containing protein n=1 Tax=Aristolochia fimbriata TaxID=158543 RepID=A0AAV7F2L3_ARIFI|nr:hypothetical protein H6P81_007803 [Aristolochia fimbriata]
MNMWAVRRVFDFNRKPSNHLTAPWAFCVQSIVSRYDYQGQAMPNPDQRYYSTVGPRAARGYSCSPILLVKFSLETLSLSSPVNATANGKEDAAELENHIVFRNANHLDDQAEITSESEASLSGRDGYLSEVNQSDLVCSDVKLDVDPDNGTQKTDLFDVINWTPNSQISAAIDKWLQEGNSVAQTDILVTMSRLRRCKMFGKALRFVEWLEASKRLDFNEQDYASRLDLVAKVQGLDQAEKYINKIPEPFQGELVYRTLLANYSANRNLKKSEDIFNRMRNLGFRLSAFSCDQLLLLYKKYDEKKIADVLSLMELENVEPSLITYRLLIDAKGRSGDLAGMEQVLERMKAEGIGLTFRIKSVVAKSYIYGGFHEKAEVILKEMEEHRWACSYLFPLYAILGKASSVEHVWKLHETSLSIHEYLSVIEAWGKLGQVQKAEEAFEKLEKKWKLSSKCYTALLKVYAHNRLLNKAKSLLRKMSDNKHHMGPYAWDAIVRMYATVGEVETADSILQMANVKAPYSSFMVLLCQYAQRGDIHNTEKIFQRYREAGHAVRRQQYQPLLQAYLNARAPAYGFRERLKADNILLNRSLSGTLKQVEAFNKWNLFNS